MTKRLRKNNIYFMYLIYYFLKQFKPMKTDSNHHTLGYLRINKGPEIQKIVEHHENLIKLDDAIIEAEEYGNMPPNWSYPLLQDYIVYESQQN